MDGSASLTMGVKARCRDGVCGRVAQVVLDPIDDKITHLIVEPEHRQGRGRLVPAEWAEPRADHVDLTCTRAEFNQLEIAEGIRFLQGIEGYMGYEPDEMLLWPYFGANASVPVVADTLPLGEVAIQRGEAVFDSDGRIGDVEGLIVDSGNHQVSHVVLQERHLFGRKQVAIPIAAVKSMGEDGIRLSIGRQEVGDLPEVQFHRRGHRG